MAHSNRMRTAAAFDYRPPGGDIDTVDFSRALLFPVVLMHSGAALPKSNGLFHVVAGLFGCIFAQN